MFYRQDPSKRKFRYHKLISNSLLEDDDNIYDPCFLQKNNVYGYKSNDVLDFVVHDSADLTCLQKFLIRDIVVHGACAHKQHIFRNA